MKIGFFTDTYFPQINGVTYTIKLWKKELEKQGHEVFVYYPKDEDYKPEKNEIPLQSFPFIFYKGYNIGLPSFRHIEKDLDVVHLHGFISMAMLGMAVSRKQEIPCILTYHTPPDLYLQHISSNELMQEVLKVVYYRYEKKLIKRCQLITTPSEIIMEMLEERLSEHISKALVLSNGIDIEFFKETKTEKFKKDYNVPEGRVIGFTGRHSKEKHLEDLINFADKFDGTILLAGDGQNHEDYKKMAKGKKNVRFLGFLPRERLCEFYSCLDLLILPSTAETEGLVVLEANSCGTPAIGANAMALKNTIQEGINGYLYEPSDMRGLEENVEKAYKNMKKMKPASKKHSLERSVKNTTEKLVQIYKRLEDEGMSLSGRK